jgi:hypothetical protein
MHCGLALIPLIFLSASCAADRTPAATSSTERECFWGSQVTGFGDAGPDRAILNIGQRESWELTVAAGCPDVDWALDIGIRARGGDRICHGRPAELFVPNASGSGFRRCLVRDVRKLTPEEAATVRGQTLTK